MTYRIKTTMEMMNIVEKDAYILPTLRVLVFVFENKCWSLESK